MVAQSAAIVAALAFLTACLPVCPGTSPTRSLKDATISADTVWSGDIEIDGQVRVFKQATLTLKPGTTVRFVRADRDRDGLGDGTLIVEGRLIAIGSADEPIRFLSAAADPKPGDWLELRVDFSRETLLKFCEIRDSAHGLHAHFTKAAIEDSHLHRNIDGTRLGQGNFLLRNNLIEENEGKGLNFRNSTIEIRNNLIRNNNAGIFIFETDRPPVIEENCLTGNIDNLRLGDFFHTDLAIGSNWWGTAEPAAAAATIYDHKDDESLGRVSASAADAWIDRCGVRRDNRLSVQPPLSFGGFVDAAPLPLGTDLIVADWSGTVSRIETDGRRRWHYESGDVIDSRPESDGQRIYLQNWGRKILALDAADGALLWSREFPASTADDHRQGAPLFYAGTLYVPSWSGRLYALNPETGRELWQFDAGSPLRAAATADNDRLYLGTGDGSLVALSLQGEEIWRHQSSSALLSPPLVTASGPVVIDRNGTLSALDRDGGIRWQRALDELSYYAAPLFADQAVFVATAGGTLWKLDAKTGKTIWKQQGFGPVYATPLIAGSALVVADNAGNLSLVDILSGRLLDRSTASAPLQGNPVLWNQRIAVGGRDNALHTYHIQ